MVLKWLPRFCVLALLLVALVRADELDDEDEDNDASFFIATFNPGKIGMKANWGSGHVTQVEKVGQAQKVGVEVGMIMVKVDNIKYYEELLDRRLAGKSPFSVTLKRMPVTTTTTIKPEVPPTPDYQYATELDADKFEEEVRSVANGTDHAGTPPYYPLVMFHVSWCKHCRHALPEIEQAAGIVHDAQKRGQLHGMDAVPKFFVIECDVIPEQKTLCESYTDGKHYPVIKLFRDGRSVHFNRPRIANTFAWWATYVSRKPTITVSEPEELGDPEKFGTTFIMVADPKKHQEIMDNWNEVALDMIDTQQFVFVKPGSKAARGLPKAPGVTVLGAGLTPIPFEGDMTKEQLSDWVNFNQFKAVEEISPYASHPIRTSGLVCVVLTYRGAQDASLLADFQFKAKQMRTTQQFVFGSLDISDGENTEYVKNVFPLLSPSVVTHPLIFAFSGENTYWEDPTFAPTGSTGRPFTLESINALLASAEALQDGSKLAWLKEKKKLYVRLASGSTKGLFIAILLPVIILGVAWYVIKSLFGSDPESPEDTAKAEKVD